MCMAKNIRGDKAKTYKDLVSPLLNSGNKIALYLVIATDFTVFI